MVSLDTTPPTPASDAPPRARTLYRAAWRWHFYAGLTLLAALTLDTFIVSRLPPLSRALS